MIKSTALFMAMFLVLMGSLLLTCKKQDNEPVATENEVAFSIDVINLKSGNTLKSAAAYNLADADKIILTIQNSDGSATKYTSAIVKIQQMNGVFYTQKIVLKTGNYNLTGFLIVDATDSAIFATPLSGSQESQNISNPLPIAFSVAKNITTPVTVEVLSTEKKKPEDFGLSHFPVIEVKTFSFMIGVVDNSSDKIFPAKLTVSNGTYTYAQNLDSVLNNIVTVKDGLSNYTLTIENTGFISFTHTYTIDSLKIFTDTVGNLPLLVELEKIQGSTVTDYDGNVYHTVTIGTQVWMVENLRTTRYNDGTSIPLVTDNTEWSNLTTHGYCWYNNDLATYGYGALYNWYTVNTGKLAPSGWHVPTDAEWIILTDYLGGFSVAGGKLKEIGTMQWITPNTGATNETGFTALPGGQRSSNGSFLNVGRTGNWWSSTEFNLIPAYSRRMNYSTSVVYRNTELKPFGFSVRCLRD